MNHVQAGMSYNEWIAYLGTPEGKAEQEARRKAEFKGRDTFALNLLPLEKYGDESDPRHCRVDLTAPYIWMEPDGDIACGRVMPLLDEAKFCRILKAGSKTFAGLDATHFWVSGYYAVHFDSTRKINRKAMKALVQKAIKESGGFMTPEIWLNGHNKNKKGMRMIVATGSGSSIRVSGLCGDPAFC